MAAPILLSANDAYTWIPPTPIGVQQEAGFQPQLVATPAGDFCPMNTMGWNCQTYLSFATAGYSQTYDLEAPVETPVLRADATDDQDEKPKPAKAPAKKAEK
jgi:hypothetical protein